VAYASSQEISISKTLNEFASGKCPNHVVQQMFPGSFELDILRLGNRENQLLCGLLG